MDNRLKQDILIEDALKSQPIAEMPRSVTADVMARIQTETRPACSTSVFPASGRWPTR